MKGTYVKIETRRFEFERTPVGWNLESKVTGEVILWDHMFSNDPYDMAHVYSTTLKNFIKCVKSGWRLWFFGRPYDEVQREELVQEELNKYGFEVIESDEGCWINGGFCKAEDLPF